MVFGPEERCEISTFHLHSALTAWEPRTQCSAVPCGLRRVQGDSFQSTRTQVRFKGRESPLHTCHSPGSSSCLPCLEVGMARTGPLTELESQHGLRAGSRTVPGMREAAGLESTELRGLGSGHSLLLRSHQALHVSSTAPHNSAPLQPQVPPKSQSVKHSPLSSSVVSGLSSLNFTTQARVLHFGATSLEDPRLQLHFHKDSNRTSVSTHTSGSFPSRKQKVKTVPELVSGRVVPDRAPSRYKTRHTP